MSRQKPYNKQQQRRQHAQQQARRKGIFIIAGVIVVALVIVGVLVFQGNRPAAAVGDIVTVPTQTWPQASDSALGPANAPVVVKEFADFQCPYCRKFDETIQKQIIDQYVKTGQVRYEYHHFIIIDQNVGGTESLHAALASECAAEQNDFWNYHEILFANQGTEGSGALSDARLKAFAESQGLNMTQFNSCLSSQKYKAKIAQDAAQAQAFNVQGTPSLFVNNQPVQNPLDWATVKAAIDAALKNSQSK